MKTRFGGFFLCINGGVRITPWGALPLAGVEARLDGVDHHRRERDFLIEGILPNALVKIDREVDRSVAETLTGFWKPFGEPFDLSGRHG